MGRHYPPAPDISREPVAITESCFVVAVEDYEQRAIPDAAS
jgi:hypothetical protein